MGDSKPPFWFWGALAIAGSTFLVYALVALSVVLGCEGEACRDVNIGTFGDSFGVFSAVFAGSAFVALLWTVHVQNLEFKKMSGIQADALEVERNLARISLNVEKAYVKGERLDDYGDVCVSLMLHDQSKIALDVTIVLVGAGNEGGEIHKVPIWAPGVPLELAFPIRDSWMKRSSDGMLIFAFGYAIFYQSAAGQLRTLSLVFVRQNNKVLPTGAFDTEGVDPRLKRLRKAVDEDFTKYLNGD